jgi:MazG family protein
MKLQTLITLVETLRMECPWDRAQTLASLKSKLIEESYELVEAIDSQDRQAIKEEIGDILFLGLFMAKMFEDEHSVTLDTLVEDTVTKYREKHPHVFKDKDLADKEAVLKFWHGSKKDVFAGIPKMLPALMAAMIIQERAARLGFDWESYAGALEKVLEEVREVKESTGGESQFEECGDLLFACVNLLRHLSVDPEDALKHANKKFVVRFRKVLEALKKSGKDIDSTTLEEMDALWENLKDNGS